MKKRAAKLICLLMVAAMLFLAAACTQTPQQVTPPADGAQQQAPPQEGAGEALFTAGTFTGTAPGFAGPLSISVTVSEDRIESIALGEHYDTIGIADVAFDILSQRIIEHQSLAVDAVSGATLTSFGVQGAVSAALMEAGADAGAIRRPVERPEVTQGPTENVDVVIVGSGFAGLMAAYELHFNNPDLSFVLLEQLDFIGGQTATTGGVIYSPTTPLSSEDFDVQTVIDLFTYQSREPVRGNLIRNLFAPGYELLTRYLEMGATFYDDAETRGAGDYWLNVNRHTQSGPGFATFWHNFVAANPIDLRTASQATGLLVNADGEVYGVSVRSRYSEYEIHASAVLLATGGFGFNDELKAEYLPMFHPRNNIARVMPGATGDGILFTRRFGTPVVGQGAIHGVLRPTFDFATIPAPFIVNTAGERFANEAYVFGVIQALDGGAVTAFRIADSNLEISALEARLEAGALMAHDSLEDLARARGIDVDTFLATVQAYNAAVDAQESPGFGLPADAARRIDAPPFFSEQVRSSHIGTIPGILVDDYLRVLDGSNNPVPGLYAAGEVMFGNFFTRIYPAGGTAISTASYGGPVAIRTILSDLES